MHIVARKSINEFIEDLGIEIHHVTNKGWATACCPIHQESRPSFAVLTTYPYVCKCFACGFTKSLVWLTSEIKHWPVEKSTAYIQEQLDLQFDFKKKVQEVHNVPDVVAEAYRDCIHRSVAEKYLRSRRIPKWVALMLGIGYDDLQKSIMVPMRNVYSGKTQGFFRQYLDDESREKDCDDAGKTVMVPEHIWTFDRCYVVEGFSDAARLIHCLVLNDRLDGVPVALGGASFTKEHALFLRKFSNIVVAFDHDFAGERGKNYLLKSLSDHPRVFELDYPMERKDPGEILPDDRVVTKLSLTKPQKLLSHT